MLVVEGTLGIKTAVLAHKICTGRDFLSIFLEQFLVIFRLKKDRAAKR